MIMEYWSNGVMGVETQKKLLTALVAQIPVLPHSRTPAFQKGRSP
jgi:hypothetical protein